MKGQKHMQFSLITKELKISIPENSLKEVVKFIKKRAMLLIIIFLTILSISNFIYYLNDGLGLAYNDARSHLDIGRRIVENLKPGFAQMGSVWLPLPHLIMTLTIWNDFMWHSGLSGAIQSMVSYVATGVLIYLILKELKVGLLGRVIGVLIFAINVNIMYMQSTAMTELLLLATMTAGCYELMLWHKKESINRLIRSAFWIMLSTLIRYDGWFLFLIATALIVLHTLKRHGYKTAEGVVVIFCSMAGFGIFLWFLWNQLIFKDALYFAFGPYSANAQQNQLELAGVLTTKKNLLFSTQTYIYALVYNAGLLQALLALPGVVLLWLDKNIEKSVRISTIALFAPFFFNVLALFLGHSVLFVQGLSGNSWFNVRYGLMMVPTIAIFVGYLINRLKGFRLLAIAFLVFVSFFAFVNRDAVTIDDARIGKSGKNVTEVSSWLKQHAENSENYILISVASHDAIVFSSGLPMKRFIHEGTSAYWDLATAHPDRYAKWIILRTGDQNDLTFRSIGVNPAFKKYTKIKSFPFSDIYELKSEYLSNLRPLPVLNHL